MGKIHALLVGVDDYPASVAPALQGCGNDVALARRLLTDLVGERAVVEVLLDREATVAAVTDAVVRHLGAAGPGDTALLWFAGHGTQLPATGADLLVEATGMNQAVLCADGPLLDKRLGALLDTVTAGGARVTAVLDCCHSGGATREDGVRYAPPRPAWKTAEVAGATGAAETAAAAGAARDAVTEGPSGHVPGHVPGHVLMAASRLNQPSHEDWFEGRRHGVFTHALTGAARAAGPDATCRELLAAATSRIRRDAREQQPVLFPDLPGGAADQPFLGPVAPPSARGLAHLLRFGRDGWEVDCGSGHGLRDGAVGDGTEFTVVDVFPAGTGEVGAGLVVRARDVRMERTLVDPVDWVPDLDRVYSVVLSALAEPPGAVHLDGPAEAVREVARVLAPSPLLRVVDGPGQVAGLYFGVRLDGDAAHVERRDGTPFTAPLPFAGGGGARRVADCLEHLTRWHRIRDLTPRPSPLDGLVRVEIAPWDASSPDEMLLPDGNGEIVCPYTSGPDGPEAPWVSIRLHNRSPDRTLWCLLLDLTDRYACHSVLYPGHFIGPGRTGHALDGAPVRMSLPRDRPAVPGAEARDWLKLIVAERELPTWPFQLPDWDPHTAPSGRDLGAAPGAVPARWTTLTVPLRTLVPGGPERGVEPVTGPGG